jgi:hypothetical protein
VPNAVSDSGLHKRGKPQSRYRLVILFAGGRVRYWFVLLLSVPLVLNAQRWLPPLTIDGQPDLQGVWNFGSNVPLERPNNLGAKEFYTPQEAAEKLKQGFQGDRAVTGGAHYDLAQFGLDPSQATYPPNLRTSLIVGPEGKIPPETPAAEQRDAADTARQKGHEFDGPENRPLGERCILFPTVGPPMLPFAYNNNLQIFQSAGYVAILQEIVHDVRVIPIDGSLGGRPHLPATIRQWRGDSRGHWEHNTLVVDTTNFSGQGVFFASATESLHVIERFTRTAEDTLLYEFTVEDPATWVRPWTAQLPMMKDPHRIFEFACHEGNYGMANTLSGARAADALRAPADRQPSGTKPQ